MPWRDTGYHRYYFLDRERMLLPRLAMLVLVAAATALIFIYVADSHWHVTWPHHRLRGKGAGWVYLGLAILSLPAWARTPITFAAIGETFVYNVAMLIWTLDNRPDFAIGPNGVYGIDYLKYRSIAWRMIEHVEVRSYKSGTGSAANKRIRFIGKKWDETRPDVIAKARAPKLTLLPYRDVKHDEILELAKQFHPSLKVVEIEMEHRSRW